MRCEVAINCLDSDALGNKGFGGYWKSSPTRYSLEVAKNHCKSWAFFSVQSRLAWVLQISKAMKKRDDNAFGEESSLIVNFIQFQSVFVNDLHLFF